jgi:hypothetical protein
MPKIIVGHRTALPTAATICATAVGALLGFSSCGGYVWHDYLGYGVLLLAVLAVLLRSESLTIRAGLAMLVVAAFFVARAAGFATYVGADSPSEYLRQLGSTFSLGLC